MTKPARGRPRDAAVDQAVLGATIDLLAETGLHGVTIEAIAARSGVSRPTIYRRWTTREHIVIAALTAAVRPLRDSDSGDTRRDLYDMLRDLVRDLDARVGPSVLAVHAMVRPDSPLAEPLRERYLAPRAATLSRVIARGVAKGHLRADLKTATVRDLVFGPPIYHLLMTGRPMTPAELRAAFDAVWTAIAVP